MGSYTHDWSISIISKHSYKGKSEWDVTIAWTQNLFTSSVLFFFFQLQHWHWVRDLRNEGREEKMKKTDPCGEEREFFLVVMWVEWGHVRVFEEIVMGKHFMLVGTIIQNGYVAIVLQLPKVRNVAIKKKLESFLISSFNHQSTERSNAFLNKLICLICHQPIRGKEQ